VSMSASLGAQGGASAPPRFGAAGGPAGAASVSSAGGFGGGSGVGSSLGGGGGLLRSTGMTSGPAGPMAGTAAIAGAVSGGVPGADRPGSSAGGAPGAAVTIDPSGNLALVPAPPPPPLPPFAATPAAGTATTRAPPSLALPPLVQGQSSSQIAGAIGLAPSATGSSAPTAADARSSVYPGLVGVPLKPARVRTSSPPPPALAYRRRIDVDPCSAEPVNPTPPSSVRKKKGRRCGCDHP
jgi:hypothetical protein